MASPETDTSMALRTAELALSLEPEQVTEELAQGEIDIWGERLEPTDLSEHVVRDSEHSVSGGAFGDIFRGTYYPNLRKNSVRRLFRTLSQPQADKPFSVAIKVVRQNLTAGPQQDEAKIHLDKEIAIWQRLHHDNILPFLGVSRNFGPLPSPIAQWQANGTAETYLHNYKQANRLEILRGIANGLSFLHGHTPQIVHGDLKPNNILISDWGEPYLSDFGISGVDHDHTFWKTKTGEEARGTIYYMSPAQLTGELKKSTTSTDVYAFAMTSYHIMTGQRPFPEFDKEATIILEVGVKDKRPARPADDNDMTDDLWRIIENCWATHPAVRPPIRDIVLDLTRLCATERPLRLLSIDGGGVSAMASLFMLKALMDQFGPDASPCDHFDMIAGSEVGGVIAIMLGRLRMGIYACIGELKTALEELYDTKIATQKKRVTGGSSRFAAMEFIPVFGKLVNPRVVDDSKDLHDKRPELCRTFVMGREVNGDQSADPRIRTYPTRQQPPSHLRIRLGMGATMSYPMNFGPAYEENLSRAKYNNPDIQHLNPSSQLLQEARSVFGGHRAIGTLVSLGSGISKNAFNADKEFTAGLPEALTTRLRHSALAKEEIHSATLNSLEPGTYYRFDPASVVDSSLQDPRVWQELFGYEIVGRMDDIKEITEEYVKEPGVEEQMKVCVEEMKCRRLEGSPIKDGYQPRYVYPDA